MMVCVDVECVEYVEYVECVERVHVPLTAGTWRCWSHSLDER
jgi:hypothetical protein